jgi:hypothetical protein
MLAERDVIVCPVPDRRNFAGINRARRGEADRNMLSALTASREDDPRYSAAELIQLRGQMLQFSRSIPPGPERNERRQIASSLRRLFRNKMWLLAHPL